MTRITNTDQVLMLLRNHLERAKRGERKAANPISQPDAPQTALDRIQDLARHEDLPRTEIENALVRGLLTNEFGPAVSNDARFQVILDDVLAAIRRDEAMTKLLDRTVTQILQQQS